MWEKQYEQKWRTVPNPFLNPTDTSDVITGRVSGRSNEIAEIVMGGQSAIILAGAPSIGKSSLIRYLQRAPNAEWSWRNELADFRDQLKLDDIRFVQIDLTRLEGIEDTKELLNLFREQCTAALQSVYQPDGQPSSNLKVLRELVRSIGRNKLQARCFVMLDAIERLGRSSMGSFNLRSVAQTDQERGIALLDHCGAIRMLVDLIDEFSSLGVILSIESLPRPNIGDQFTHVSADLARFTTMTLQTFTWNDTKAFLAQEPENFGSEWAKRFRELGKNGIFSNMEQAWLLEQAGTHPYLLQQFCFHIFHLKKDYMDEVQNELQESYKSQLIEWLNGRVSTFLTRTWKRLQEAIGKSSQETKNSFENFINLLTTNPPAEKEMNPVFWNQLGAELRYILSSEGIVRYDLLQPIHYPGSTLRNYLVQKAKESSGRISSQAVAPTTGRGFWLTINCSGNQEERLSLSELEYLLLKTLLQSPERCNEAELMKGAWGETIPRPTFTQRMHHLRRKLKEACRGTEIIENRYGGLYSLNHPEWFHLE